MGKRIIYQMLPRYFGNIYAACIRGGTLEENGCGKFSDITSEVLCRLRDDLKITDIWYTGVLDHATTVSFAGKPSSSFAVVKGFAGSPYAIRDYSDVAPYLADNPDDRMTEFEQLIKRTHDAGLRVIMDFVPNHVAREYRSSAIPLGENDDSSVACHEENDFLYIPGECLHLPCGIPGHRDYHECPAKVTGNDCYSAYPSENDWYDTVKLNYCSRHTGTWDKMAEAVRFWASKGVDGFRCDMAEMVPAAFFSWMIRKIKDEFGGNICFIAEVYDMSRYREYSEAGFDLLYDKSGLYDTLRHITVSGGPATGITRNWQALGDLQPAMLNFLENHDEQRIASDFFCGSARKAFAALHVSLLFNDAPFMIYSGQEYGERGMDSEGFSGVDGRTTIYDFWSVGTLRRALTGQLSENEKYIYSRYCHLLSAASGSPAFSEGKVFDLCYANMQNPDFNPDRHFAFLRYAPGDLRLVAANFSDCPARLRIRIPQHAFEYFGIGETPGLNHENPVDMEVGAWDGTIAVFSTCA